VGTGLDARAHPGLGIAAQFPISLSLLIDASDGQTHRATALGSLATGLTTAGASPLLGALERSVELEGAMLLVPFLAILSLIFFFVSHRLRFATQRELDHG